MTLNVVGGRFIIRKTDEKDKTPTVSTYDNHMSGKWIDTDIYEAELYINTNDNKIWFRNNNNQIIEIPTLENSKIKDINLPDMFGRLNYLGIWDLNSDTFPKTEHKKGDYCIIGENGIINGIKYVIGDFIVFDGRYWDKVDNYRKEKINTSDINYSDDIKLNDILLQLINRTYFENGIVSNKIKIIDEIEVFKVDIENFSYMGNLIYHNGNCNNNESDWKSNNLTTNTLTSTEIYSNYINTKEIKSINVISESINTEYLNTDTLSVNSGIVKFDNGSVTLTANGKGIYFNYLNKNILNYKSFDNYITSYTKIKYDSNKSFDNDFDLVSKNYVDNKINETQNIDINDLLCNEIIIYKDVKYINININIDGKFELLLDEIEKNINSSLITICVDTSNNVNIDLSIKSSNNLIFNINNVGIVSLYFNTNNKKWYKNKN